MPTELLPGMHLKMRVYCSESANTSQVAINTVYFRVADKVGAASYSVEDVNTFFDSVVSDLYKPMMSNLGAYRGTTTQLFRPLPLEAAVASVVKAGAGTAGASLLPPQVAFVASFYTDLAKVRGRIYVPFLSGASMDANGSPDAGFLANANILLAFFAAGMVVAKAGSTLVLRHEVYSPAVVADPLAVPPVVGRAERFTDAVDWRRRDGYGTQRRRGFYGRPNSLPI